ncbi:proline-rich transmembrane protein 1-like [Tubulanus polymorphus]|uniref:proline-rich transmembrane protein 1-like n=1 Tax=Tubulanus polymorphus TaxID=672921 RepID=UPI003DA36FBA
MEGQAAPPPYDFGSADPQKGLPNQQYFPQAHPGYGYHQSVPEATTVVVTQQPAATPYVPVSDHLGFAICTMLCCCLPFGIVGLIKAMDARDASARGDRIVAAARSHEAKNWCVAGLITGLCCHMIWIVLLILYIAGVIVAYNGSNKPYNPYN